MDLLKALLLNKNMDSKEYINKILTEWNPLGVPEYIADVEYIDYVPIIMNNMDNIQSLCSCLEKLLIEKMGFDKKTIQKFAQGELLSISQKIIELRNQF